MSDDRQLEPGEAAAARAGAALRRGLATTFFFSAFIALNLFLVPAYSEAAVLSDSLAGILIGTPGLAALLLVLPAGRLPNRWGFARVVQGATLVNLTGAALLSGGALLIGSPAGLALAFLGQVLYGAANAAFWPSMIGYYINIPGRQQADVQAVNTGVQGVGFMVGPVAAGVLVGSLGLAPAFAAYLAVAAAAAGAALRLLPLVEPAGDEGDGSLRDLVGRARGLLRRYGPLRTAAWSNVLTAVAGVAVGGAFFILWGRDVGYAAGAIGLMLTVREGAGMVSRFCFGRLRQRWSTTTLLVAAPLGGGLTLLAIPWLAAQPVLLVLLVACQGAMLGLMAPAANQAVAEVAAPREVGPAMAINVGMFNVGTLLGPPLVGVAADLMGYPWALSGAAALTVVVMTAVGMRHRDADRRPAPAAAGRVPR